MKTKYTKEHSTGYKVGGLELIAEELIRVHIQFLPRQSWKQYDEFLGRIFQALPGTLGKI